jgi:hypothetical protein
VFLASSIIFMSIDACIHAHSAYVAIATRADCGSVWQYNPPFSIKYDILSKPKASSKQPESSELRAKNRELWENRNT